MTKSEKTKTKNTKTKNTKTKKDEREIRDAQATDDIKVSIIMTDTERKPASLEIETAAGKIWIKGFAVYSSKKESWFFSGPSHMYNNEYQADVFGNKDVFESINNAINALMEE